MMAPVMVVKPLPVVTRERLMALAPVPLVTTIEVIAEQKVEPLVGSAR